MQSNLANLRVHHESLLNLYYGSKEEYLFCAEAAMEYVR